MLLCAARPALADGALPSEAQIGSALVELAVLVVVTILMLVAIIWAFRSASRKPKVRPAEPELPAALLIKDRQTPR